ncbi:TonB family protein [Shewanella sediminis HAW-EB3]|uniref:TonB family protein n=1 Tax=Shewanella sediminis (strain HAW-EB3) TaxID=425104 RepID=A8FYL3_SHESH|nr:TonB family protein [Shewanella sediminis]ABV37936.1 TonB family protein [Shewanella sediminis HAW-EB3]
MTSSIRLRHLFAAVTLSCLSMSCFSAFASEFSQSYTAYKQAVAEKNSELALKYAGEAYELGSVQFGAKSLDTATLALNYATALEVQDQKEQANSLYLLALEVYQSSHGEDALEVLDPLIGAAQTSSNPKTARSLFEDAIDISSDAENRILHADTLSAAFTTLSKTRLYNRKIRNYALDGYEIYKEELPQDSLTRVKAAYIAGSIHFVEKKNSRAIPLLNEVVKQFSALNYTHPYELKAHAYLVELYEREGESDKSTEHCIAIGSMRPWLDDQEQVPLYRQPPEYPLSYVRRGKSGWAEVSFLVDELGFVKEPKILDSEGGSKFSDESIKALKQWRYAPKFVDGSPIAAETRVRMEFTIERKR